MTPGLVELIPALDPAPIPGPVWLFQGLLLLTFFLHVLFLNLVLGGTLMAAAAQVASGGRPGDPRAVLAARITAMNAYGVSFAITTGVAPLLFVQILLGRYFYTATLLVAWVWLGMLALLAAGYYALYVFKLRSPSEGSSSGTVLLVASAVLFLAIAFVHVGVNLIHAQPERWAELYGAPWRVFADPAYWPRLAHFVLGAVSLSAAVTAWWALRQAGRGRDGELNRAIARQAWRWLAAATALQVIDGVVLLVVLPRRVLLALVDSGASTLAPLGVGITAALGLLVLVLAFRDPVARPAVTGWALAALALALAWMTVTRHQVRGLYLEGAAGPLELAVAPQWGNLALFGLCLALALATVGWMVRRVLATPASGADAA